jgi:hypothetical protein
VKEARQLCVQAGQAWRCVSLAGGGPWGPLPVGLAAVAATDVVDAQVGWGDSAPAFVQLQMSAAHCMHGWQHTCLFSCIGWPGGMEPCGAACVMQQCIDAQQTGTVVLGTVRHLPRSPGQAGHVHVGSGPELVALSVVLSGAGCC